MYGKHIQISQVRLLPLSKKERDREKFKNHIKEKGESKERARRKKATDE
jgi:ribosomal protein L24